MRKLDISGNYSITSNGMRGFVDVIQLPASKFIDLRLLDLFSRVDEDVVIGLIMAMANNTTIKILEFDSTKVSESGRNVMTKILCDTSSIASICNLNHTWQSIVNSHNMIPKDLLSLLDISNNMNKAEVIRRKIIVYFFSDTDNGSFAHMSSTTILPNVIKWIGRDILGYNLMFNFVQAFPTWFDIGALVE